MILHEYKLRQEITELTARIDALWATGEQMVATDEGTHSTPQYYRIYETIRGERRACQSFAGANWRACSPPNWTPRTPCWRCSRSPPTRSHSPR